MLDRIKRFFGRSLTILWARLLVLGAALLEVLTNDSSNSHIVSLIRTFVSDPTHLAITIAVIGIITELARWRSLRR